MSELTEVEADRCYLAVTEGLHAGVELTGQEIISHPKLPPGVMAIRGLHPAAVDAGLRFAASGELGGYFTDKVLTADLADLDADQLAARSLMTIQLPHIWLGIDPHDSVNPNANALVITDTVTARALGVAAIMDMNKAIVMPNYPFLKRFPNFVSVETTRAPETNPLSRPDYWMQCLAAMDELGPEGMDRLGLQVYRDLKYYIKVELLRIDTDGNPDPGAIETLKALEGTETPGPYFTPFEPSHPIFKSPRFRSLAGKVCVADWDDHNRAPELPELGRRADGRSRTSCFGSLLIEMNPPAITVAT